MIVEFLAVAALTCHRQPGPWPLPAPGTHKCATVIPDLNAPLCIGAGTRIFCPTSAAILERIARRRRP